MTGTVGFADCLGVLESNNKQFTSFCSSQIAQNSLRLYYRTLGRLESGSHGGLAFLRETEDFFDDFELIKGPFKYNSDAEEWEGVQQKIGLLCNDLALSTRTYHPEYSFGGYRWVR